MEVHQCPDGLWFNANKKQCQTPAESGCTVTTEVSPTWTTPIEACWGVRPSQTILRPYPGDCNRFIECYGAQSTVMVCPPHLYFNEVRQLCDWPSESGCDGDDDPRCVDGTTSYWPHPECTKYIECYQGQGYTMECPSGLYFDPEDIMCEDPSQSSCGHTEPTIGPTTTKDSNWTPDPICPWPSNERYLFPYPGDCTKFWECAEGERVAMDCPDNLWFNPILLVCDYPYQSGCIYG
ncbi:peritrophic matrix protein 5-A [Asbolus verrucosus]|uniref:Peritrophic matrix protein 5-A n=1 Tax=Asbolus verrucosus TaxID=1661398 RepID=A0A482VM96_ASBVE|nr:peritrophic matrix protein 5-A [Asbolus verrucosus]